MLIDLNTLVKKYKIKPTGVLHVGAHRGEEARSYAHNGFSPVFWVEANPSLIPFLNQKFQKKPGHVVINAVVSDEIERVSFNVANNGESSSLLDFGTHSTEHPEVVFCDTIEVDTITIEHLDRIYDFSGCGFWNFDIQGAELKALIGAGHVLNFANYIYAEVNRDSLYEGGALIGEIDDFLGSYGFDRKETVMTRHGWGDALYVRVRQ